MQHLYLKLTGLKARACVFELYEAFLTSQLFFLCADLLKESHLIDKSCGIFNPCTFC